MSLLLNSVAEMTLSSSGMQKSQRVCAQANVVRVLHLLLYEVLLFVYTRMLSTIYQYYSKVILVLPIGLAQVFLRTAFPPLHLPPETPTPRCNLLRSTSWAWSLSVSYVSASAFCTGSLVDFGHASYFNFEYCSTYRSHLYISSIHRFNM